MGMERAEQRPRASFGWSRHVAGRRTRSCEASVSFGHASRADARTRWVQRSRTGTSVPRRAARGEQCAPQATTSSLETEAAGVNARGVGLGDLRDSLSGHNHVRNTWPALRIVHALVVERGARRTARKRAIALTRPVSLLLGPVHPTKDDVPDSSSPDSSCTPSRPAAACLHSPRLRRGSFHSLLSGVRLGGAGAVYRLRRGRSV